MAWALMDASETGSLLFIHDITHDIRNEMNAEVYRRT